jgi:hypothetical protein
MRAQIHTFEIAGVVLDDPHRPAGLLKRAGALLLWLRCREFLDISQILKSFEKRA